MNQLNPSPQPQPDDLEEQNSTEFTQLSLPKKRTDDTPENTASSPVKTNWPKEPDWAKLITPPAVDLPEESPPPPPPPPGLIDPFSDSRPVAIPTWAIASVILIILSLLVALISLSITNSTNAANATASAIAAGTATGQAISQVSTTEAKAATSAAATTTAAWYATGTAEKVVAAYLEATKTMQQRATATAEARIIQRERATVTAERVGTATAETRLNASATANRQATGTAEARSTITYNETALAARRATATAEKRSTPTATPTGVPQLNVTILGCNLGLDVTSLGGEVANAWVTIQNVGTAQVTDLNTVLRASDETNWEHPDKRKYLQYLPPGYEISYKLTADASSLSASDIVVTISTAEGIVEKNSRQDCKTLDENSKLLINAVASWGVSSLLRP